MDELFQALETGVVENHRICNFLNSMNADAARRGNGETGYRGVLVGRHHVLSHWDPGVFVHPDFNGQIQSLARARAM